jgi:hypothetical protein
MSPLISSIVSRLAANLQEVATGRALTVVSSARFAATLIGPREPGRLRALNRTVSWFAAAGLDLAKAGRVRINSASRVIALAQTPLERQRRHCYQTASQGG